MATTPRSWLVRISRPKPCLSLSCACGKAKSPNQSPPAAVMLVHAGLVQGAVGHGERECGQSPRGAGPCRECPRLPRTTACRTKRRFFLRLEGLHQAGIGHLRPDAEAGRAARIASAWSYAAFRARWDVNSRNAPPCLRRQSERPFRWRLRRHK